MHVTRSSQRPLLDSGVPGIERGRVWDAGHGVAVEFCRMESGAVYPKHSHRFWEQMFVIDGRIDVDGAVLEEGDFAFTEPGEFHEVRALAESVLLLSFGRPPHS